MAAKVAGGTFTLNNDKALVVGSITRTVGLAGSDMMVSGHRHPASKQGDQLVKTAGGLTLTQNVRPARAR